MQITAESQQNKSISVDNSQQLGGIGKESSTMSCSPTGKLLIQTCTESHRTIRPEVSTFVQGF